MLKTVIINRTLSATEQEEVRQLVESGAQVFSFTATDLPDFARLIAPGRDDKKSVNYSIMNEVLQFGDWQVDNQTVAELFSIETASVWHYHKFRVYFVVAYFLINFVF